MFKNKVEKLFSCIILFICYLTFSSCTENNNSFNPPNGTFHFPVSVATKYKGTTNADECTSKVTGSVCSNNGICIKNNCITSYFAYVVNSNFDLAYSFGTIKPIDLKGIIAKNKELADSKIYESKDPCTSRISELEAKAKEIDKKNNDNYEIKPSCIQSQYSITDNKDLYYKDFILDNDSVKIGSFGGEIIIDNESDNAFVSVREGNLLLRVIINPENKNGKHLICGNNEAKTNSNDMIECDGFDSEFSYTIESDDPYALTIAPLASSCLLDDKHVIKPFIFITSLISNSIWVKPANMFLEHENIKCESDYFKIITKLSGISSIKWSESLGKLAAVSRFSPGELSIINPIYSREMNDFSNLSKNLPNYRNFDYNISKSFEITDNKVYVTSDSPEGITVYRLNEIPVLGESTNNQKLEPIDFIPLFGEPTNIKYFKAANDKGILIVNSFATNKLHIIDELTHSVIGVMNPFVRGPFGMHLDNELGLLIITGFESNKIVLIDLGDGSLESINILAIIGAD